MQRFLRTLLQFCLAAALLWPAGLALAQETTPSGPVYVVQSGDTLSSIALRFGITVADLQAANNISDPNQIIRVGDQLIIPGLEGIQGVLTTQAVPFGETLHSLSLRYQVAEDTLIRLNHITSPQELYAGSSLVIPQGDEAPAPGQRLSLAPGQSLLELAILHGSDPYTLAAANGLPGAWAALPGDVLRLPGVPDEGPGALPSAITAVELTALTQGQTTELRLYGQAGLALSGSLLGHPLNFFPSAAGEYTALQGIHAMLTPGIYPLTIQGALPDGTPFGFSQQVSVLSGGYLTRLTPLSVDPSGLDASITRPEDEMWSALAQPATPDRYWSSTFQFPLPALYLDGYSDYFGNRRFYNADPTTYFHTGLDIPAAEGVEVYAAAPGKVVFAGRLEVRGCAIMIDHGWGVYTAVMHLQADPTTKECIGVQVQQGQQVETGQLIGLVGNTGLRTTGSHLHWEVLVGGVQVDPLPWMSQQFP